MALWLFKVEPDCYNFSDLERDRTTAWDGVANALAQKHLRAVKAGDRIFCYHTGKEKAVIGIMEAEADPTPAPDDESGKRVEVRVRPVARLERPVTLAEIKAEKAFEGWELIRMSRLSIMPVQEKQWKKIEELSRT